MLAIIFTMMVFIVTGESQTCQNDNCDNVITTMRMISNLKQKLENFKSAEENYKKDNEGIVAELKSNWTKFNQESQQQKMMLSKVQETMEKLNASGGQPGPQGEKGEQGEKGQQGLKGGKGEEGQKGDPGANATKGDTGATGMKGDIGPTGPKGDQGPTGPTCCPVDPCVSSPCQNGGLCEVVGDGYKCTCPIWITGAMCQSDASTSCQMVAECAAGVGYVYDLNEETPDSVLVSGMTGIARCNVTGGSGERIQKPASTSKVYSTILTGDGEMWSVADPIIIPADPIFTNAVYKSITNDMWQRELEDLITEPFKLEINENKTLSILDSDAKMIKSFKIASQPSIETTIDLNSAATWDYITDFAVLPSGAVVVTDDGYHCARIINMDGGLVATAGTCGTPGGLPNQLNTPQGVFVDKFANILISDLKNNRISVFNGEGVPITTLCQGELVNPNALLVTSSGYLMVYENGMARINILRFVN